jgi:flagellar biosynthesis/type III secretory pathway protein FliH
MNSVETNKLQWKSDPLLTGKKQKAAFAQTSWDQSKDRKFGTWGPESDPKAAEAFFKNAPPPTEPTDRSTDRPTESDTQDTSAETDSGESSAAAPATRSLSPNTNDPAPLPSSGAALVPTELLEQQIRIARQQGYVQGLKDGMAKTLQDLETERAKESDLIQKITTEIQALQNDATRMFEPLRKLALHIAEQLVRGELSTSGEAVERLVKACVADLNGQENGIHVSLNSSDLERVQPLLKNNEPALHLQPDMSLLPGSVRVRCNDTVIEDLIDNRLEGLARQLLAEPDPWLKNSSRLVGAQVESVESSFAERKKTAIDPDIDDVMAKAPFTPAAQDVEEVQATAPEEESTSLTPAADEASTTDEASAAASDAVNSATEPTPSTHAGDQAYL